MPPEAPDCKYQKRGGAFNCQGPADTFAERLQIREGFRGPTGLFVILTGINGRRELKTRLGIWSRIAAPLNGRIQRGRRYGCQRCVVESFMWHVTAPATHFGKNAESKMSHPRQQRCCNPAGPSRSMFHNYGVCFPQARVIRRTGWDGCSKVVTRLIASPTLAHAEESTRHPRGSNSSAIA